ncbi:hypothetical protein DFH11DRAFT_1729648 [Phellopilus nigrolimitatus]|nr:hypothetical protein DFH11DRAFT_1729648 [Phellopilus nigrolimitatus]
MTTALGPSGFAASGGPVPPPRVSASSGRLEHARHGPSGAHDDDFVESSSEHEHDSHGHLSAGDSEGIVEDAHYALTNQSLNSDGTPKRPMNAFMIFARRRRPQVSAANQMMRTGEISKILSKEWNSMPMSEKQFYLDQAKKLKDNFNSKYPDYVYRRRPNNSRRRRRADGSISGRGGFDNSTANNHDHEHDDASGSTEFEADSPIDVHMSGMSGQPASFSESGSIVVHPPHHPAHSLAGLGSQGTSGSSSSSHFGNPAPPHIYTRGPFTASNSGSGSTSEHTSALSPLSPMSPFAALEAHAHAHAYNNYRPYSPTNIASNYNLGYNQEFEDTDAYHGHSGAPASASRLSHLDWPSGTSPGHPAHSPALESHHRQPHSAYPHSPDDPPTHSLWGPRFDALGRTSSSNNNGTGSSWPLSSLSPISAPGRARALTAGSPRHEPDGAAGQGKELFSPALPHRERAWSTTPSSASGSSVSATSPSAGAGGGAGAGLSFPTLTEAYRPGQHQQPSSVGGSGRSASTSPSVGPPHSGGGGGSFYPTSGAPGGGGGGGGPHLFPPLHGQGQGQRGPAALLHPISTFTGASTRDASPLSAVSPHSSVSHGGGYWSGERVSEGR